MSNTTIKWDFFIAHAGDDQEITEQFYEGLTADSRVFLDSKCIKPGDDWDHALSNAQKESLITVVLISVNTETAYYQREEIAAAIAYARENPVDHSVIPVYLDEESNRSENLPYGLRTKHGFTISENCSVQSVISKLIEALTLLKHEQTQKSEKELASSKTTEQNPLKTFSVPFRENPLFTGREKELLELYERLTSGGKAAVTQAIRGLGGIGKTQLAVKYAYQYQVQYEHVFWVQLSNELSVDDAEEAEPTLPITNAYVEYCQKLQIPFDDSQPQLAIHAFKGWMEQNSNWLLIFDNADQPKLLKAFLPAQPQGHILLTSRAHSFDSLGILKPIEVEKMPLNEATEFLIERVARELDDSEKECAEQLAKEIDGLPLALEQAGAYIHETSLTFKRYLANYQRSKLDLLAKQKPVLGEYPESVQTTWSLNFEAIRQQSEASADVLRLSAFLAPDVIPYELIAEGTSFLGDSIHDFIDEFEDPMLAVVELLQPLADYSLINMTPGAEEYSIHRLVQEVMKAEVRSRDEEQIWTESVVNCVNEIYPWPEYGNWSICRDLSPQSRIAIDYVKQSKIETENSGNLLSKQGCYFCEIGEYQAAEPLYLQDMEISRAVLGENHPDFATTLNNLAELYQSQGRYEEAEPLYLQAIEIRRAVLGEDHSDFGRSLDNLAGLYGSQGRYEEAEPLYLQAIEISRAVLGENHPDFATSLDNLAGLYESQGRYAEAEPLYLQAIEISRAVLDENHPDFATSLNNLALLYKSQGRYAEAEPLYLQAIEISRAVLGENHPDFATSLNNLAGLYASQGRYDEAEPLSLQAMEIRRAVLGENHPSFATSLNNLALLYGNQGRYAEAEPLSLQAMKIRRAVLGENHPDFANSLNNLALLYKSQGRYAEAEPLYLQAMEIRRAVLGENHPDFANSLNNLAGLYASQGRYVEAEPLSRQVMEIRRAVLGENHPDFATNLNNLAGLYRSQGRYAEAEPLYLQAIDIFTTTLGLEHPSTKTVMKNYKLCKEMRTGDHEQRDTSPVSDAQK